MRQQQRHLTFGTHLTHLTHLAHLTHRHEENIISAQPPSSENQVAQQLTTCDGMHWSQMLQAHLVRHQPRCPRTQQKKRPSNEDRFSWATWIRTLLSKVEPIHIKKAEDVSPSNKPLSYRLNHPQVRIRWHNTIKIDEYVQCGWWTALAV